MPIKTAAKMDHDELIQIRVLLGKYHLKAGGWCRLGEFPNGTFFIEAQKGGEFQSKCIPCEPSYIVDQHNYFGLHPELVSNFDVRHPELLQHFSKRGKPKTHATIIEDFLESTEGTPFVPPITTRNNNWFDVMKAAIRATHGGKIPKLSKPFNFNDWAENKD